MAYRLPVFACRPRVGTLFLYLCYAQVNEIYAQVRMQNSSLANYGPSVKYIWSLGFPTISSEASPSSNLVFNREVHCV